RPVRRARSPPPGGGRRQPGLPASVPHRRRHRPGPPGRAHPAGLVPGGRADGGGARPGRVPRRGRRSAAGPAVACSGPRFRPLPGLGGLRRRAVGPGPASPDDVRHGPARRARPAVREAVRLLAGHHVVTGLPYQQAFWCVRGLVDGAWLLRLAGAERAAAEAEAAAGQLRDAITASLEQAAARLGRGAMPATPERGVDAAMIGSLDACRPLDLLPADDPWITGTLDLVRERFCLGDAFYDGL